MILNSAQNMYRYFLTEIRKERTVVITPTQWTSFINPIVIDWIKTKLPTSEFNQKRIEDLQAIKVLTYGTVYPLIFRIANNVFNIPINSAPYPNYMHGISTYFYDIELPSTIMRKAVGKILRSDKRGDSLINPYRKANDDLFVYFENRGNKIYCSPETGSFNYLALEYYSYPIEIIFDGTTDVVGSFGPSQNKEILDMAITSYLERVSNVRIQTQPQVAAQVPK